MIRDATEADIPRILEMGAKFFRAMNRHEVGEYSEAAAESTTRLLIENGILLVSENGMVGGLVYPFYMTGRLTAQEFFWWSEDGKGRELMDAFEKRAKEMGAETIQMIALESLDPQRVGKIYERAGYKPAERSYIKVV